MIGLYSAIYALYRFNDFKNYQLHEWYSNSPALSHITNPYILAQRAQDNKINLDTNEDVIFKTNKDENGDSLKRNCVYEIDNLNVPCSFYTINCEPAYKEHPEKEPYPYKLNSDNLLYDIKNAKYDKIKVASILYPQGRNWLVSPNKNDYTIVLNIYNILSLRSNAPNISLPKIHKVVCY